MSKVVKKLGEFSGVGGKVPIMGVSALTLGKTSEWKIIGGSSIGILSTSIAMWKGDAPVEYPFEFNLVAGVGAIDSRDELYRKIKIMHSWAAHQGQGKDVKHPPAVHLTIPGYISCVGAMTRVNTSAKPPWESKGGKILPTECLFTGTFLLMPGYKPDAGGVDIVKQITKFSAKQVAGSFYKS